MSPDVCRIVGIGDDGLPSLTERALDAVLGAEVLVGPPRVLAMMPPSGAERRCRAGTRSGSPRSGGAPGRAAADRGR